MKIMFATLLLSLAAVTTAYAGDNKGWSFDFHRYTPGHPSAAPEIDPASAGSALTLLAGGLAVIRGRRAKRK